MLKRREMGGNEARLKNRDRNSEEMILKMRTEGLEGASPTEVWERSIPGCGNSMLS